MNSSRSAPTGESGHEAEGASSRTQPGPPAARLRRPGWSDPRLALGLVLVVVSTTAGAWLVADADRTVPVYAAATTLSAGSDLTPERVVRVRARLGAGAAAYLSADAPLPDDAVLFRTHAAGELIPRSAVGAAAAWSSRPVGIPLSDRPSAALVPGSAVDIWASARADQDAGRDYLPPESLARSVPVYEVSASDGLTGASPATVQVLLPPADLPAVLDALANDARMTLVPVPGSAPPES